MSLDFSAAGKIKVSPEFKRPKTLKFGLELGSELEMEPELNWVGLGWTGMVWSGLSWNCGLRLGIGYG